MLIIYFLFSYSRQCYSMDELPQALSKALEEPSPLVELDNDCQTSAFNSPKLTRRQSRKRRGRKRRADPNPVWEHAIKFSDGSDTSLDEALKDYMENVTSQQYHSDSASEDAMMVKRLSSLNVTSSSNLYGESDSVTETHTILKRPHKRKKRFKRMAVDEATPIPDFIQEGRQKRPKLKKSKKKKTDDDDIENSQNIKGRFGFDITSLKKKGKGCKSPVPPMTRRKDSSPQSPSSGSSHRDSNPQSPYCGVTEEGVMEDLSKKGACCSQDMSSRVHSDSSYPDDGRKQSGSDGASETTLGGRAMECCTSNESDVTMEATPKGGK